MPAYQLGLKAPSSSDATSIFNGGTGHGLGSKVYTGSDIKMKTFDGRRSTSSHESLHNLGSVENKAKRVPLSDYPRMLDVKFCVGQSPSMPRRMPRPSFEYSSDHMGSYGSTLREIHAALYIQWNLRGNWELDLWELPRYHHLV